ncbi:FkbM family methyltransferase [Candidatus Babeliales bacterium]|nr:FkbM family methyltransferase [Candidatus Babeliales bacterium]
MYFKNRLILKIASITRKRKLYKLDWILRKIYNPEKRKSNYIDAAVLLNNRLLMRLNTSSYLEWYIFFYGIYEPMISRLINFVLKPGGVAIDVGANIGAHSLVMGQQVGRSGKVYCFEPHPQIIERLIENISLNGMDYIIPIKLGLANNSGVATLFGFDGKDSNQGTSTLVKTETTPIDGPKFEVKTITLDEFSKKERLERLDLLKIDVEGGEIGVLLGGLETIQKLKPFIIFEYNSSRDPDKKVFSHISNLFKDFKYRLYIINHNLLIDLDKVDQFSKEFNLLAVPLRHLN